MALLTGDDIKRRGIISPHCERTQVPYGDKQLSYGQGYCGYDVRIEFDSEGRTEELILAPNDFFLASTVEKFEMPLDVAGFVCDKSSLIRAGLSVHNTVIEPGWHGFLTLELKVVGYEYIILKRGMPIAQVVFHTLTTVCVSGYDGKYQNQGRGPQNAR